MLRTWIEKCHGIVNKVNYFLTHYDPDFLRIMGRQSPAVAIFPWVTKLLNMISEDRKFSAAWVPREEWENARKKFFYRDLFATQKNAKRTGLQCPGVPMKILANAVMRSVSNISGCLSHRAVREEKRVHFPHLSKYEFAMKTKPVSSVLSGVLHVDRALYTLKEVANSYHFKMFPTDFPFQLSVPKLKPLQDAIRTNELTIQLDRGKFFFCFSYRKLVPRSPRGVPKPTVALDPGIRKFQTYFDSTGKAGTIGQNVYRCLKKYVRTIANAAKKLQRAKKNWKQKRAASKLSKKNDLASDILAPLLETKKRQKNHWRSRISSLAKKYRKATNRIQNITKDAHYKICHWLLRRHDHVILPRFNVNYFVKKNVGLSKITRKAMLQLGHYKFRQRLIEKASEYPTAKIYVGGEMYTSQTCGSCGTRNRSLGSSEIYWCVACPYRSDRDLNAARNILLLYCQPKK